MKSTSLRLRALRDRINLRGLSELSFEEKVKAITEIVSTFTFSPRDLSYVRVYLMKLKARHPDLTEQRKVLLAELDGRFAKRQSWISERVAKKRRVEHPEPAPTPAKDLTKLWGEILLEEKTSGDDITRATTD